MKKVVWLAVFVAVLGTGTGCAAEDASPTPMDEYDVIATMTASDPSFQATSTADIAFEETAYAGQTALAEYETQVAATPGGPIDLTGGPSAFSVSNLPVAQPTALAKALPNTGLGQDDGDRPWYLWFGIGLIFTLLVGATTRRRS